MPLFRWLHFFELQRQWTTISLNSTERPGQKEQITLERREVGTSLQTRKCKNKYLAALLTLLSRQGTGTERCKQTALYLTIPQIDCARSRS